MFRRILDALLWAFRWLAAQCSRVADFLGGVFGFGAEKHGETPAASVQTLDGEALSGGSQGLQQEVVDDIRGTHNVSPAVALQHIKISDESLLQIQEKFKQEIKDEIESLKHRQPDAAPVTGRGWKAKELTKPLDEKQTRELYFEMRGLIDAGSTEVSDKHRRAHFTDQLKILYADKAITSFDDLQKTELKASGTTLSAPMKRTLDGHLMQLKSISFVDTADDPKQCANYNLTKYQWECREAVKSELRKQREEWAKNPNSPVNLMGLYAANMARATTQEVLVSYLAQMLGGAESAPVIHHDKYQKTAQLADLDKSVWPPADRAMGHFASKYIRRPNTLCIMPLAEFAPIIGSQTEGTRDEGLMKSITGIARVFVRQVLFAGNTDPNPYNLLVEQALDEKGHKTYSAHIVDYGIYLNHTSCSAAQLMSFIDEKLDSWHGYRKLLIDMTSLRDTVHDVLRSFAINGDIKCGLNVARINDYLAIGVERLKQAVECKWPKKEEWKKKSQEIRLKYQPVDVEGFWSIVTTPGPTTAIRRDMADYIRWLGDDGAVRQINDEDIKKLSRAQKCVYYIILRCGVDATFAACVQRTEMMIRYERQSAELMNGKYTLTLDHIMDLLLSYMSLQQAAEIAEQYSGLGIVAMTQQNVDCFLQNCYTMQVEMVPLLNEFKGEQYLSDMPMSAWAPPADGLRRRLTRDKMLYEHIRPLPKCLDFLNEICDTTCMTTGAKLHRLEDSTKIMAPKLGYMLLPCHLEQDIEELGTKTTTLSDACSEGISKEAKGAIGLSACP